jgi:hypothetical protein
MTAVSLGDRRCREEFAPGAFGWPKNENFLAYRPAQPKRMR